MSTTTYQVSATTTATLLVAAGSGPHLIINLDPANTLFIGDTQAIRANDPTGIVPVAPNGSVAVDGNSDKYGITATGVTVEVATVLGGMSTFQPLTTGSGQLLTPFRVYSGGIAELGSLVETFGFTATSVDSFSNHILAGYVTYSGGVPGVSHATFAIQVNAGTITWYGWNGSAWNVEGGVSDNSFGQLNLSSQFITLAPNAGTPKEWWIAPTGDATGVSDLANLNFALANASKIHLMPGTYFVNAPVVFPPSIGINGTGRSGFGINRYATIKAVAAMSAVLCSAGWLTNANTVAQEAVNFADFKVDCNNLATHGIVTQNYDSVFERLVGANCSGDALRMDVFSQDTTTQITTSGVNNQIYKCVFENVGRGIASNEPAAGAGVFTDGRIKDCDIATVSGAAGIDINRSAGWQIDGNHLYGLPQHGIRVGQMFMTHITKNYIETWGTSAALSTYRAILDTGSSDEGSGSVIAENTLNLAAAPGNAGSTVEGIQVTCVAANTASWAITGNLMRCEPAAGFAAAYAIALVNNAATSTINATSTGNNATGNWTAAIHQVPNGGVINLSAGV